MLNTQAEVRLFPAAIRLILLTVLFPFVFSCTKEVGIENMPAMARDSAIYIKAENFSYESRVKKKLEEMMDEDNYFRTAQEESESDYSVELKEANYYLFNPADAIASALLSMISFGLYDEDLETGIVRCAVRDKEGKVYYKRDFDAYWYDAVCSDKVEPYIAEEENSRREEAAQYKSLPIVADKVYKLLKERTPIK